MLFTSAQSRARHALFAAASLLAWCAGLSSAQAVSIADRAELQLRVALFDLVSTSAEGQSGSVATRSGGLAPHLGLGLGFAPSENVLFDASLGVRSAAVEGGGTTRSLELELGPSVRYVADGGDARFFVGAALAWSRAHVERPEGKFNQRRIAIGPFIGVHAFINDYVSIDPALGLSWVTQAAGVAGYSDGYSDEVASTGYRFLMTIALTAWLNPPVAKHGKPARALVIEDAAPEDAPVGPPPTSPDAPVASSLRHPAFTLELRGNPARRGDAMQVRLRRYSRSGSQLVSCPLVLVDGKAVLKLQVRHTSAPAGPVMEEVLTSPLPFKAYERWISGRPHLRLCGKPYDLQPEHLTELRLFARLFRSTALDAGTLPDSKADAPTATESAEDSPVPDPADASAVPASDVPASDVPTSDVSASDVPASGAPTSDSTLQAEPASSTPPSP